MGYWTAAHARGREWRPALDAVSDWAFDTLAADGLERLELLAPGGQLGLVPGRGEGSVRVRQCAARRATRHPP
ncbi:hypothetical protein ACRAWF_35910 [Streptomyces sp. L7]